MLFAAVMAHLLYEETHEHASSPEGLARSVFERISQLRERVLEADDEKTPTPAEIAALDAMLSSFVGMFYGRCGLTPPGTPLGSLN